MDDKFKIAADFADEFCNGLMLDIMNLIYDKFESIKGFDGEDKNIILTHLFLKMAHESFISAAHITKVYAGKKEAKNFVIEFLDMCKEEMIENIENDY